MTHTLSLEFFDTIRQLDVAHVRAMLQTAPELAQAKEMGLISPLVALYERSVPDTLTEEQQCDMARQEIGMEETLLAAGAPIRDEIPRGSPAMPGHWPLLGHLTHECFNRLEEDLTSVADQVRRFQAWTARIPQDQEDAWHAVMHAWHKALKDRSPVDGDVADLGRGMLDAVMAAQPPDVVFSGRHEAPMSDWIQARLTAQQRERQAQERGPRMTSQRRRV